MRCKSMFVLLASLIAPLAAQADKVNLTIPIRVPLQEGINVPNAVLAECELERKLAKYLASEAKGPYNKVIMLPTVSAATPGHALDIRITQVLAPGGGKWSGPKVVTTAGTLYDGGQVLGTFVARRQTHKGRHTCRMLQNDAEEIAEDIGKWLKKPTMDAKLGDAN
jgi:hypothetical protein